MKASVRQQLWQINQTFYKQFAHAFAATRYGAQPGWHRIIPYFPNPCQLLDLGCGNGRFAHFLQQQGFQLSYTGIDGSEELIAIARSQLDEAGETSRFLLADLGQPGWESPLKGQFDVVVALAVLHHIPDEAMRAEFVKAACRCLRHDGALVISTWRFTHNARMQRKIMPWATVGLSEADVEENDYLLNWHAGGQLGYRYAHECSAEEIRRLAALAGCRVIEQFTDDGREGDLSLYSVLRPEA